MGGPHHVVGSWAITAPSSWHTAAKTSNEPARLAVCERADTTPAWVRPVLTTRSGLPAPRAAARPSKARAVEQAFHVHAERFGAGILDQVVEHVTDLDVDLVADGDAVAEADAVGARPIDTSTP